MDIMFHRVEPESQPTAGGGAEQQQGLRMTINRMLFDIDTGVDEFEFPCEIPFAPRDDGGLG